MKQIAIAVFAALLMASSCKKDEKPTSTPYPTDGLTPEESQKALVLEATGAWCQFCPRGAELMLRVNGTYGEDVLGLALHGGAGTDAIKNPVAMGLIAEFLPGTGYPGFYVQHDGSEENDVLNDISVALAEKPELAIIQKAIEKDTAFEVYVKLAVYESDINVDYMVQSFLVADAIESKDYGSGIDLNQISALPYVSTGSGPTPTKWTSDQGIVNGVATVKSGESFYHLESVILASNGGPKGMPLAEVNPFGKEYIAGDILGTKSTPIKLIISKKGLTALPIPMTFSVATIVWRLKTDGSGDVEYVNGYISHVEKAK